MEKAKKYIPAALLIILAFVIGFFALKTGMTKKDGQEPVLSYAIASQSPAKKTTAPKPQPQIEVRIIGEILYPGSYSLPKGSTLQDLITVAGGFTQRAYLDKVNPSSVLKDGQNVEIKRLYDNLPDNGFIDVEGTSEPDKLNINLATKEEILSLPGITEDIADEIIESRGNALIANIAQLKGINGMTDDIYKQIEPLIDIW